MEHFLSELDLVFSDILAEEVSRWRHFLFFPLPQGPWKSTTVVETQNFRQLRTTWIFLRHFDDSRYVQGGPQK